MSSNLKNPRLSRNILQSSPRSGSKHSKVYTSPLSTPKKRRARDTMNSLGPQRPGASESFVMKLFDRSLDLSKYNENTALYPICRAWIKNEPRNPNIANYRQRRSPSPIERRDNGPEFLDRIFRDPNAFVLEMPKAKETDLPIIPPIKKPTPNLEALDKIIAAGYENQKEKAAEEKGVEDDENAEQKEIDTEAAKSADETKRDVLLKENLKRWRSINAKWLRHCNKYNEQRYKYNFTILEKCRKRRKHRS